MAIAIRRAAGFQGALGCARVSGRAAGSQGALGCACVTGRAAGVQAALGCACASGRGQCLPSTHMDCALCTYLRKALHQNQGALHAFVYIREHV